MNTRILFFLLAFLFQLNGFGQSVKLEQDLLDAIGVSFSLKKLDGKEVVQVVKDSTIKADDEPTFVKLKGIDFRDGTIEVNVLSKLLINAPSHARGFIGVAFRINETNSKFECIYIRPTNGRADDQIR